MVQHWLSTSKHLWISIFLMVLALPAMAQLFNPVKWSTDWKQTGPGEYDLLLIAQIDPDWNIYSQYLESDDGPVRTSVVFEAGSHFTLVGKTAEEGTIKKGYDDIFGMNVIKLLDRITFRQHVKVSDPSKPITGYVEFMTCDKERCLPPTEETFRFQVKDTQPVKPSPGGNQTSSASKAAPSTTSPTAPQTTEPMLSLEGATTSQSAPGILDPVHWKVAIQSLGANRYALEWTATLDPGWAIYSQFTSEDGPIPTTFTFDPGAHYTREGVVTEKGKLKEGPDPLFANVVVKKFISGPVIFRQVVTVADPTLPITGFLNFMTCDDTQCLPGADVAFRFEPNTGIALAGSAAETTGGITPLVGISDPAATGEGSALFANLGKPDPSAPASSCGIAVAHVAAETTLWRIFVLGFLGGLLALLTPCVFPMIPLTVSFFTKSSHTRAKGIANASLYGGFILLVYLLLSIPFHLMDSINPDILNDISTNVWLNLLFFVIFVAFAFSFFGYYELTLPSSWTNRVSAAEGIGGVVGVFFMALTLALVSFSCTGPILGSLLAGALTSDGGAIQLTTGMGGFGLALALPFALFAAFPNLMKQLPKSGGWLNTVKVVLGFLELALALKFLSNADLVKHWGILKVEPFLGLWILIFLGLALYLFGIIRFPHDSPVTKRSITRMSIGALSLAFVFYLASGFGYDRQAGSYRPLKLLSGLAPPVCYSWFYDCDCPQNLSCFKDLESGLAYARANNKPVMIDFTGYACVNCRKMEEHVWPETEVYQLLKDDYVLISLYVDDKQELPIAEQLTVPKITGGTRILRTVGNKWSHFQTEYFQTNSQPYYVLLSPDGQLLNTPVGYTPDSEEYANFLRCGLDAYEQLAEKR